MKTLTFFGRLFQRTTLAFALALSMTACVSSSTAVRDDNSEIPTCKSEPENLLSSCPTERCMAVYLAPWCGYCERVIPAIKELPRLLAARNIATCVVVGRAETDALQRFVSEHGLDASFDEKGQISVSGVPYFFSFDRDGNILSSFGGYLTDSDGEPASPEAYVERLNLL